MQASRDQRNGLQDSFNKVYAACGLPVRLAHVDLISSLVSLFGIVYAIAHLGSADGNINLLIDTWHEKVIFTTNRNFTRNTRDFQAELNETCSNTTDHAAYTMGITTETWNNTVFTGVAIPIMDSGVRPWGLVFWVIICSFLFQMARYLFNDDEYEGQMPTPNRTQRAFDYAPTVNYSQPINPRKRLFKPSPWIRYAPSEGPDFWRWVEYALTSPMQIVLVAISFSIGERSTLVLLGTLQGALVMFGFFIELQCEVICCRHAERHEIEVSDGSNGSLHNTKTSNRTDNLVHEMFLRRIEDTYNEIKLVVTLMTSFVLHGVIWTIIFERFYTQSETLQACEGGRGIPSVVFFILYTQAVLFSCFGAVSAWQCGKTLLYFGNNPTLERKKALWYHASYRYSILSVTAKTLLEFGFISLAVLRTSVENNAAMIDAMDI